jgi:hypothetical protein
VIGRRARGRLAAAAVLGWAGAVSAQPSAASGELSAGVVHRQLVERADDGTRLVSESGELLRIQATASLALPRGGALRVQAAALAGELDYDGHTQVGAPLASHSAHRDISAGVQWRPLPAGGWGEGWLLLEGLQQRRTIAPTDTVQGLRETSVLVMAGARWTHAFDLAGWRWQPALAWRASLHHAVDVDSGGLYDAADLRGGHRRELQIALDAAPLDSPWRFGVAWSRARQSASAVQALSRGGVPVGTVRQPRIAIDDLTLRVTRAF